MVGITRTIRLVMKPSPLTVSLVVVVEPVSQANSYSPERSQFAVWNEAGYVAVPSARCLSLFNVIQYVHHSEAGLFCRRCVDPLNQVGCLRCTVVAPVSGCCHAGLMVARRAGIQLMAFASKLTVIQQRLRWVGNSPNHHHRAGKIDLRLGRVQ